MRITSSLVLLLAGMLAGIVLVLSCGDNSPSKADAAPCDCPAAEPPLGGRLVRVSTTDTVAPNTNDFQSVGCPEGGLLISGSCTDAEPQRSELTLQQSGFHSDDTQGWVCYFKNNGLIPITIKATAICLVPGP